MVATVSEAPQPSATGRRAPAKVPARAPALKLGGIRGRSKLSRLASFVLGTIWLVFVLGPIWYMVLISFRSPSEYLSANAWVPTGGLSLSSYSTILHAPAVGRDFLNSGEVAVGTILVVVTLSLAAGYRIARRGSRYSAVSFRVILFGIAIPIQAIVIPLYFITNKVHIYDTMYGLVLVLGASLIPVAVLLMVNYLRLIPRQLYDAMAVDGAGAWTTFTRLVIPMARPVLAVICIYAGLGAWNAFLLPLILTQSNNDTVLPLGMYKFASSDQYALNVPVVMAVVVLSALPLLVLYIGLRRQFVQGIGGFALR
jgi:ABC-type glycerol-3-phosphate transport system permease component